MNLQRDILGANGTVGLFRHWLHMTSFREEQAERLRSIAAEFRTSAAQTRLPDYRNRMLEMAVDLEQEAARLEMRAVS